MAQLDLADVRAAGGPDWLPSAGRLSFFYEIEAATWGLYPSDAGSFAVVHDTGPPTAAIEPDDLSEDAKFSSYPVTFIEGISFPGERFGINWSSFNTVSQQALEVALEALHPPDPMHQIGGYPCPVQSDSMEVECQALVRGGKVEDWRLLLQLDTDDGTGMMWGDVGALYFWIREQDARAGDFSKVWMVLQCH